MDKIYFKCSLVIVYAIVLAMIIYSLPLSFIAIIFAFAPLNIMVMAGMVGVILFLMIIVWSIIGVIFAIIDFKKRRDPNSFIPMVLNFLVIFVLLVLPSIGVLSSI